jgi:hypothetical protein
MKAGACKSQSIGAGRWRCLFALSFGVSPIVSMAQSGGVTLRIELKAESVDDLHAWRRAQGLEGPPTCADAHGARRPLSPDAQRRLRRTFVLDEHGVWQPLAPDWQTFAASGCFSQPQAR